VALAGDRIVFREGRAFVNGAAMVEDTPAPPPAAPPPIADPAAPTGPPRRGWWKRLVE